MNDISGLNGIFKKFGVRMAYLFGSRAKGKAAEGSDYDVAVLFKKEPQDKDFLKAECCLSVKLQDVLKKKVDVISLNSSDSILKYEVVKYGKLLYCEAQGERISFEVKAMQEYFDAQPMMEYFNRKLRKKILERA